MTATLYYLIPQFDKYYKLVDSKRVQEIHNSNFPNTDTVSEASIYPLWPLHYLTISGLQRSIEDVLIATLQKELDEIEEMTLLKLFEIYHEKLMDDVKRGYNIMGADENIILAKLANHPNLDTILKEYQGYIETSHSQNQEKWQKMLAIIDTVPSIE